VLIPFGLFGEIAFASGIKIRGAGRRRRHRLTLFSELTADSGGNQPTIEDAIVLAALSLLGFGIFGPEIVKSSSGPQLFAGSAVGTDVAVGDAVSGRSTTGMAVRAAVQRRWARASQTHLADARALHGRRPCFWSSAKGREIEACWISDE